MSNQKFNIVSSAALYVNGALITQFIANSAKYRLGGGTTKVDSAAVAAGNSAIYISPNQENRVSQLTVNLYNGEGAIGSTEDLYNLWKPLYGQLTVEVLVNVRNLDSVTLTNMSLTNDPDFNVKESADVEFIFEGTPTRNFLGM